MEFHKRNGRNVPYSSIAVDLNKVISSWSANQKLPTLDCVSVCFKKNQICAIVTIPVRAILIYRRYEYGFKVNVCVIVAITCMF